MRLRNLKNKEIIIENSEYIIENPYIYKGKFSTLFNNNNPIYIEIGMGKGKFLTENAKKFPNINFIGIEKCDNIIARAIKNIPKNISNLKLIRADAQKLDEIFNYEIEKIYLNFSDPWPKIRQSKRRLTSPLFLEKYEKIFKKEKNIYLRTDNYNLYRYSIETLSNYHYGLYDVTFDLHNEYQDIITTEYEDKFVKKGEKIYALKARKK